MPNCFTLTKKGETKPSTFVKIDEELCEFFNVRPHETNWFRGWYNSIGLGLAMGYSWDKMREMFKDNPKLLEIVNFLAKNYDSSAWYETK